MKVNLIVWVRGAGQSWRASECPPHPQTSDSRNGHGHTHTQTHRMKRVLAGMKAGEMGITSEAFP
jgi:hypothetical protein